MTQGKGICLKAERKRVSETKQSHEPKWKCMHTLKEIYQTCCGNEALAGSSTPGMISKGTPAAIWHKWSQLSSAIHDKNIDEVLTRVIERTWVNIISSSLIGAESRDWSFGAKFYQQWTKWLLKKWLNFACRKRTYMHLG